MFQGGVTWGNELRSVYRLKEGENDWLLVSNMTHERSQHACAFHDNYIYAIGGYDYETGGTAERLNLSTMTWEELPMLDTQRNVYDGHAFSFQSFLYHINYSGDVVKLTEDNKWENVTEIGYLKLSRRGLHHHTLFYSILINGKRNYLIFCI